MKFKDASVKYQNFKPELWLAVIAAAEVYTKFGSELVITSGNDGKHDGGNKPSKHFEDLAFDCRIWDLNGDILPKVAQMIKNKLGINYDVVIEKNHIHIEYDPKG